MKKILFFCGLIVCLGGGIGYAFFYDSFDLIFEKTSQGTINNIQKEAETSVTKAQTLLSAHSKIEALREKYALKGLIYEGEMYLKNDQYNLAIKQFTDALEQNPGSNFLLEKIGDTYGEMHRYDLAYATYKKISPLSENIKEKRFFALLYSKKFDISSSIDELKQEIQNVGFSQEETFYYTTILECSRDIHTCKKIFQDYFSLPETRISFAPLKDIQTSFTNYQNFQLEDIYYKNTLFIGSMLQQKLYPLVIQLGRNLNQQKPDYRPIIQMIAQSLYEIGEYTPAKKWLELYLRFEPNDEKARYLMGVLNLKIGEYILSNIQLIKASELGYEPKIQLKRRLIYNYYILQQSERMLKELYTLITDTKDFEQEDLYLALYYHIISNELDKATKLAEIGNQTFPNDATIYGYYGWIFKERGDLDSAQQYLQIGIDNNPTSAFLLLNMGYVFQARGLSEEALEYFNRVLKESPKSEFGKQAQVQIDMMSPQKNQAK